MCHKIIYYFAFIFLTSDYHFYSDGSDVLIRFFGALRCLSLMTLSLDIATCSVRDCEAAVQLIEFLLRKRTLFALHFDCGKSLYESLCVMLAQHGSYLRYLNLLAAVFLKNDISLLIQALTEMVNLEFLRISVENDALDGLGKFFEQSGTRCCIRTLSIKFADDSPADETFLRFFLSLRCSRIACLELDAAYCAEKLADALFKSRLLKRGHITEMVLPVTELPKDVIDSVSDLCRENLHRQTARRNLACRKACLTLIATRRRRKGIMNVPVEIVIMVAKRIWETRGCYEWDDQQLLEIGDRDDVVISYKSVSKDKLKRNAVDYESDSSDDAKSSSDDEHDESNRNDLLLRSD